MLPPTLSTRKFRRTYGRTLNENTKKFMAEIEATADSCRYGFAEALEKEDAVLNQTKPGPFEASPAFGKEEAAPEYLLDKTKSNATCSSGESAKLPHRKNRGKNKQRCAFGADRQNVSRAQSKRQLPSPPAEDGNPPEKKLCHSLSSNQKRKQRYTERQVKEEEKDLQQRNQLLEGKAAQNRRVQQLLTRASESTPVPTEISHPPEAKSRLPISQPPTFFKEHALSPLQPTTGFISNSNTDDMVMADSSSVASTFNPGGTSRLEQLSTSNVLTILLYTLDTPRNIRPFYKQGMMKRGIHSSPHNDEDVISADDMDLSILRVNKTFHAAASKIFYSQNNFIFLGADPCS